SPSTWTPATRADAPETSAPASAADAWPRTGAPRPAPPERLTDEPATPPWAGLRPASTPHDDLEDDDFEDEDEPARRLHPYTWLHVLVLAVVAFVLGFLIMLLVIQARDVNDSGETAAALLGWVAGRAGTL
ncbi:hypothetical protein, partial [Cellulomonas wangsupingiae]